MTKRGTISNYYIIIGTAIICILVLGSLFLSVTTYGLAWSNITKNENVGNNSNNTTNNIKAVIVAFDDAWKSQFTSAKPILDRFGFKGSFFIVCNYVGKSPDRMSWNDIQTLERQGHDIESHSMNHIRLDDLSQQQLNYEIGQSKQCIIDHSLAINNSNNNVSIFAYPYDVGHNNITVINTVAKYYQLGRTGDKPLAYLNCNLSLEGKKGSINQTDYSNGNCSDSRIPTDLFINNNNNNNKRSNLINAVYYDTLLKADRYSVRRLDSSCS